MDDGVVLRAGRAAGVARHPKHDEEGARPPKRACRGAGADTEDAGPELVTPASLREAYAARRPVAPLGADLEPAKFRAPSAVSARLVERASPTRTKQAPERFSPSDMAHAQRAAAHIASPLPYALSSSLPLPAAFVQLLELHTAVEQSLLVHIATHGAPTAEPVPDDTARVRIPHVITFQKLRPMVERTTRRTLDAASFRRLAWIWSHAPGVPTDTTGAYDAGGMGFLVSCVRTLHPTTQRRTLDWSLTLEMSLRRPPPTPPLEVHYGSPSNFASPSKGAPASPAHASPSREEMSHLALWNAGIDERRAEVARRLHRLVAAAHTTWLAQHGLSATTAGTPTRATSDAHAALARAIDAAPPRTPKRAGPPGPVLGDAGLLTPQASRTPDGHATRVVRSISALSPPTSPLAARSKRASPSPPSSARLPATPSTPSSARCLQPMLRAWHPDFPLDDMAPIPLAKLPPLAVPPAPITAAAQRRADFAQRVATASAERPATASSLEERIRAKEQAARAATSADSARASLHERSVLSRLREMADAIYLLYTTGATAPTATGRQTGILPLLDVLTALEHSSSVAMSRRESLACVRTLMDVAPGWLEMQRVGSKEWLRLSHDPTSGCSLRDVHAKIQTAMQRAKAS